MDNLKEVRKTPTFLFSKEEPKGKMFSFFGGEDSDEYKELIDNGWVDTPAKLDLPEDLNTGIDLDEVKHARPQDLIKIVEGYGFFVLSAEQLKAEAVKMANICVDIQNFSDEDIVSEVKYRELEDAVNAEDIKPMVADKGSESDVDEEDDIVEEDNDPLALIDQFKLNNVPLTSEQLIIIGKELKLGLLPNWKEETMIKKINEKLNEA